MYQAHLPKLAHVMPLGDMKGEDLIRKVLGGG